MKVSPERLAELEKRADDYFETIDKIATNPEHPQQLNAILAVQRRVWGKEKETVAGDPENPVKEEITIRWAKPGEGS